MPVRSETSFKAILKLLTEHGVRFVVVGGISAVLQGASLVTADLDVVHARDGENVNRLLCALSQLGAMYRTQPERELRPTASHLVTPGHQLLMTRFGRLDLLGEIGKGRSYDDLVSDTVKLEIGDGVTVRVLTLRKLIEVKRESAGEKDLAMLPLLERTLKESEGV